VAGCSVVTPNGTEVLPAWTRVEWHRFNLTPHSPPSLFYIISPHHSPPTTTMAPIDLRSPIDILSDRIQLPTNDTVELCHPGYRHLAPVKRIMLRLPAFDSLAHSNHQSRGTKAYGLHYSTAAAACMIISGNREGVLCSKLMSQPEFRTFIAKSSGCEHNPDDPTISKQDSRNLPSPDMLLTGQRYYFYPSGWHKDPSPDYPVCPKFRDWGFDHGGFDHGAHLQQWKSDVPGDSLVLAFDESTDESEVSIFVKMRDGACKISGFKDSTESAHLVPEDHKRWVRVTSSPLGFSNLTERLLSTPKTVCLYTAGRNVSAIATHQPIYRTSSLFGAILSNRSTLSTSSSSRRVVSIASISCAAAMTWARYITTAKYHCSPV